MNWLITITCIIIFLASLYFLSKIIIKRGKKVSHQATEYERKYKLIKKIINSYEVCEANYEWICRLFDHLLQCKYKNPEMTKVLNDRFVLQYAEIIEMKRISQ